MSNKNNARCAGTRQSQQHNGRKESPRKETYMNDCTPHTDAPATKEEFLRYLESEGFDLTPKYNYSEEQLKRFKEWVEN